jgi:hypothetical protein
MTYLHTLQITRAHAKSSQSAFASRLLDFNNGVSLAFVLTLLLSGECDTIELSTELIAPTDLVIKSQHGSHRKHRSSIVACLLPQERVYLALPSNGLYLFTLSCSP